MVTNESNVETNQNRCQTVMLPTDHIVIRGGLFWYREYQKMNREWYEDCLRIIELLSGQAERTELADELVKEADHGTD